MNEQIEIRLPDQTLFKVTFNKADKAESRTWRKALALAVWVGQWHVEDTSRVYFILCDRYVKIGSAINPNQRIRELQTASPQVLEILFHLPGSLEIERRFHKLFADYHVRGEWFHIRDDLQMFLKVMITIRYGQIFNCSQFDDVESPF